jgi:predicted ATPase
VTLVFTDIEGSTRLLEQMGTEGYRVALAEHRRIVREACAGHQGYEVDTEGDAFFYAFASAQAAVSAVAEAMTGLEGGPIRIRVGIHTGEPALDPPNYLGLDVHRAARIMAAGHGGQVVLSPTTVALLDPDTFQLKHLGEHRLKDLTAPIPLHQLQLDGLPSGFPPLKTLYRTNLPVPATPFLGRQTELTEITQRLTDPNTRLLTLTGPGGTGKTRLALQAAAHTADHYPDGITWIPLAPLRDAALVIPSIARELSLTEQPDEQLVDTVATSLLGRRALLVLDNAEHLLPGVARELAALAAACPTLHLLVTSRERLQLSGETTWLVPTLSDTDSTDLFTQRARAVRHDFEPGDDVPAICARLDHLPLAIELAAARVRSLSPTAILERLDERLPVLTSRVRDVDDRQRTLEATIAWSYDLLDVDEQRALRALSIFAGGCGAEAAERVADADLDLLERLIDRSLVRHRVEDGEDRYWMLETIREFAHDRLRAAEETAAVLGALLDWLDLVVGDVDELWVERDQRQWFRTLDRERANLMSAVAACRDEGRDEHALRLLVAADEFIDTWGPYEPFAALLEDVECDDPTLNRRVRLLYLRLLMRLGRFREAASGATDSMDEFADDPALSGRLHSLRAFATLYQGAAGEARSLASVALELTRGAGDQRGLADALNTLAVAEVTLGEREVARAHLGESETVAESVGDSRNAGIARGNMALLLLAERRPVEACVLLRTITDDVRDMEGPAMAAAQLGNLAIGLAASGDTTAARIALREALELDTAQHADGLAVEGLLVLAITAAHDGAPDVAAVLWGAAEAAEESVDYVIGPELDVYVTDILEPLRDRADFAANWRRGRELDGKEALALGLSVPEREKA